MTRADRFECVQRSDTIPHVNTYYCVESGPDVRKFEAYYGFLRKFFPVDLNAA